MGLPTFAAQGTVGALTTSGVAAYPATTSVGQILWLYATSDAATIPSIISGWTEYGTINTSGSMSSRRFYRYADGTEGGGSVTISGVTGGTMGFCFITSWNRSGSGFTIVPADVQFGTDTTSNSTAYAATAAASSTTAANDLVVSFTVIKVASGTFTGNATGGTITQTGATLGTNTGHFGARNAANTGYTSAFSRPVTVGATAALGQTFTTVGANGTGHSTFIVMREQVAGTNYTANPADNVGITDGSTLQAIDYGYSFNDPEPITDQATDVLDATRTQLDAVALAAGASATADSARTSADPVGLADVAQADLVAGGATLTADLADPVGIADTDADQTLDFSDAVSDPASLTDAASPAVDAARAVPDPIGVADSAAGSLDALRGPSDPVGLTDSITVAMSRILTVADFLALTDGPTVDFVGSGTALLSDSAGITDARSVALDTPRPLSDPAGVTDSAVAVLDRLQTAAEPIAIGDALALQAASSRTATDALGLTDDVTSLLSAVPLGAPVEHPHLILTLPNSRLVIIDP